VRFMFYPFKRNKFRSSGRQYTKNCAEEKVLLYVIRTSERDEQKEERFFVIFPLAFSSLSCYTICPSCELLPRVDNLLMMKMTGKNGRFDGISQGILQIGTLWIITSKVVRPPLKINNLGNRFQAVSSAMLCLP
jgi:hypothetical protein